MKRVLVLFFVGTFLSTFSGLNLAWSKGHVPLNKVQVCTQNGVVKNISQGSLARRLAQGGCRLPACDFDNVFMPGADCDNMDEGDGFCDDPGSPPIIPSSPAINVTSACTNPF